eukprot:7377224-Pyramimonas_sp.AAC.1
MQRRNVTQGPGAVCLGRGDQCLGTQGDLSSTWRRTLQLADWFPVGGAEGPLNIVLSMSLHL